MAPWRPDNIPGKSAAAFSISPIVPWFWANKAALAAIRNIANLVPLCMDHLVVDVDRFVIISSRCAGRSIQLLQ